MTRKLARLCGLAVMAALLLGPAAWAAGDTGAAGAGDSTGPGGDSAAADSAAVDSLAAGAAAADSTAPDSTGLKPVAAGDEAVRKPRTPAPPDVLPFGVGEKLTFSVRYEFVKAGEATIEVEDIVDYEGRRAYKFGTVARSTMPFSLIFEVEDRVESLMDVERLNSLRYEKSIKEGNYEKHEVIVFDQERHVAIYPGGKEVPLEPDALDVLSSLFYVRFMDLRVGSSVFIDNHADEKNYALEIKVLREETIKVPAGTFDCYVAEPILKAAGIFQHEGRLTVWIAKDHNNIPVKMESSIIIGAIKALLIRMENVGG